MTKKERIEKALKGEEIDRVPISVWRHFPGKDLTAQAQINSIVQFQERYDWDFVKLMYRNNFLLQDWGLISDEVQHPYGFYLPKEYAIRSVGDWSKLKPLSTTSKTFAETIEVTQGVSEKIDDEIFRIATVFCPLMIARQLAGDNLLRETMRTKPDLLHNALEMISQTLSSFVSEVLKNGANGLFFATQSNVENFLTSAEYAEYGHPYNLKLLESFKDLSHFTLLHVCKKNPRFVEFAHYPVHAINWDDQTTKPSLAEARRLTDKCLVGGINRDGVLRKGTAQEIISEVRSAIHEAGRRNFILSPGCGLPYDVTDENLLSLRKAVELIT